MEGGHREKKEEGCWGMRKEGLDEVEVRADEYYRNPKWKEATGINEAVRKRNVMRNIRWIQC